MLSKPQNNNNGQHLQLIFIGLVVDDVVVVCYPVFLKGGDVC